MHDLNEILDKIPAEKRAVAARLITELEFMDETLTSLRAEIAENGVIEDFKQGKQEFTRETPALKAYNMTIARYSTLSKQLTDLLPKETDTPKFESALDEFIAGE